MTSIREKLKLSEQGKEDRRQNQIAASRAKKEVERAATESAQNPEASTSANPSTTPASSNQNSLSKRKRDPNQEEESTPPLAKKSRATEKSRADSPQTAHSLPTFIATQPIKEVRGHTSYLTFACLLLVNVAEPLNSPAPRPVAPPPLPMPVGGLIAVQEPEQQDDDDGVMLVDDADAEQPAEEDRIIDPAPPYAADG